LYYNAQLDVAIAICHGKPVDQPLTGLLLRTILIE
jgi:hypothetical protein